MDPHRLPRRVAEALAMSFAWRSERGGTAMPGPRKTPAPSGRAAHHALERGLEPGVGARAPSGRSSARGRATAPRSAAPRPASGAGRARSSARASRERRSRRCRAPRSRPARRAARGRGWRASTGRATRPIPSPLWSAPRAWNPPAQRPAVSAAKSCRGLRSSCLPRAARRGTADLSSRGNRWLARVPEWFEAASPVPELAAAVRVAS